MGKYYLLIQVTAPSLGDTGCGCRGLALRVLDSSGGPAYV